MPKYIVEDLAGKIETGEGSFLPGQEVELDEETGTQFLAAGYVTAGEAKAPKKAKAE